VDVNERRALQDAHHQRTDDAEEAPGERSTLSVVVSRAWAAVIAAWVRFVGGATYGVAGFHLGVALDAAGVPVVGTARRVAAALPGTVTVGATGAAALLGAVAFVVGVLWTLRWDGSSETHHRRLVALALLVTLPLVLSAVEIAVVGIANAVPSVTVAAPSGPVRAFYHVGATLAIAFGAGFLWYRLDTERERGRWDTYY
jgi:hypothetical protein